MKRTAMKRSKPLVRATPATAKATVKPKKCKACRAEFFAARPMQSVCGPACSLELVQRRAAKDAEQQRLAQARQDKAKREALKTLPELKREAQQAFNRFIRARDRAAGHLCICCGKPLRWGEIGGAVDAGHYRSTGSADNLRFNEDNCHAQDAQCNRFGAGRAVDYRLGLIDRIGQDRVEALEGSNTPVKWTRDGLRAIRDGYRARASELEKKLG